VIGALGGGVTGNDPEAFDKKTILPVFLEPLSYKTKIEIEI